LRRAWSMRILASAVRPATLHAACWHSLYVFSELCGMIKFHYWSVKCNATAESRVSKGLVLRCQM
jgi:hypothetical protein